MRYVQTVNPQEPVLPDPDAPARPMSPIEEPPDPDEPPIYQTRRPSA
jgi:hypothetical protein